MRFARLLFIPIFCLCISACSIEKKCHRLERRIVKNAKYCTLVLKDTLTVKDTVYVGTVRKDSTFVMNKSVDTFYINKDRLHVQVIKEFDTLRITGQCDSIYVYREIKVPYDSVEVKELNVFLRQIKRVLKWVGIPVLLLFLLFLLYKVLVKFKSKIPWLKNF